MTIKHTGKNISAESENVITDVTFNEATGVLTFYQKNFYDGSTTSFSRDLSGVQLGVVKLADQNALNTLKNDSTKEDYKKSHLFLVPLSGNNTEGVFAEYVYVETSTNVWDFERLGSTELNLSNYIQKSQTNGLVKNDGTIDTNTYATASSIPTKTSDLTNDSGFLTSHQDISGKANISDLGETSFSNDYNDLDNKPSIPTKTSDLTNDSGFLTSHQSLTNYIQKSNTPGFVKNNGTIDDLSGKADAVHNHKSNNISDMDTVTITVTYTDNKTDTLTLFKQISNS